MYAVIRVPYFLEKTPQRLSISRFILVYMGTHKNSLPSLHTCNVFHASSPSMQCDHVDTSCTLSHSQYCSSLHLDGYHLPSRSDLTFEVYQEPLIVCSAHSQAFMHAQLDSFTHIHKCILITRCYDSCSSLIVGSRLPSLQLSLGQMSCESGKINTPLSVLLLVTLSPW